ncbi:zinc finger protein 254 [Biomphalaria pfeifferi]|uniref:Zinc finger protein 254 n=1 Tax=Biomphalaria pfeifferi TaxID=112525 RepID=A0AAD8B8D7_BIOPF|nr:zinc finger protein 254 [Biomphalaria pfeifferi]
MDDMKHDFTNELKTILKSEKIDWSLESEMTDDTSMYETSKLSLEEQTQRHLDAASLVKPGNQFYQSKKYIQIMRWLQTKINLETLLTKMCMLETLKMKNNIVQMKIELSSWFLLKNNALLHQSLTTIN